MATLSEALQIAWEHHRAGRLELAEEICRRILDAEPNHAEALRLVGLIANQADALASAGRALQGQGRPQEAIAAYRQALQLRPDFADVHNSLGVALCVLRRLDEAIAAFRRALQLKPDLADAYSNLGNILEEQGRLKEAAAFHRRAVALKPDSAQAHNNLGLTLRQQGKFDEAVASLRRAVELNPDSADAYNNLALAFQDQGNLDEAVACLRRAIELKPDCVEAYNNLGTALQDAGKLDEALASYRRALQLKPDYTAAHDNVLCAIQYREGVTLEELAEAHAEFERRQAAPLRTTWRPHDHLRDPDRPLRLGFVSPDFGKHPVGYFLVRAVENLDRAQCEVVCYSDCIVADEMTARFKSAALDWRGVLDLSHEQLAEKIRADRIDILFDLAGHTARNRLLAFARKPAPIQVSWIGYEGTTGLAAIDYLLADRRVAPPEIEPYCCEKVLRLPDGYVCYDPPVQAPPVGPLPALGTGSVTLGSFNNPTKITAPVVAVWSRILRQLPGARLILKYHGLDSPPVRSRFLGLFAEQGVGQERLELLGKSPYVEYLAAYQRIDLALDPFPFSGGATTCEALWMGVPVITCPGETFASRHSLSHLASAGLTETIAGNLQEYVDLAVALAQDLPRLAEIRGRLRQQVAASPLCDGKRFADNLVRLLRDVWRDWCRRTPSPPA